MTKQEMIELAKEMKQFAQNYDLPNRKVRCEELISALQNSVVLSKERGVETKKKLQWYDMICDITASHSGVMQKNRDLMIAIDSQLSAMKGEKE